jgi:beta-1,4-mannosyltransferase
LSKILSIRSINEIPYNFFSSRATVLYDRPPIHFHPINIDKKHQLFKKLSTDYKEFRSIDDDGQETTAFTKLGTNGVELKANRPALLVSSTSWTPDEDFSTLLSALEHYEKEAKTSKHYPKLICAITGKGPQKEYYKQIIADKKWEHVSIITPWLENEDYPLLLASADLGVCLHWSSSGLDLPMKVVDMFGSGLPVCAIDFKW